ncbi:MAG: hypothetical protein J6P58_04295 [Oscillospiraceae bacterium]|nr:hypothetical protein [Oscillospiraceae bacterium]
MEVNRIYEVPGQTWDERQSDAELDALYAAITGRRPFQYRAQDDPLYRSYADRYVQNGRMAMRNSVGAAAALTGGYGSSYAQRVGQQQYDEYLRLLSEALPELYGMAYEQYRDEGAALREQYELAHQRSADAYARERDRQADDYQRQRDALADKRYRSEQQAKASQQSYKQQQDNYQKLYKLITSSGYVPTDEELRAAGLTRASAEALRKEYERTHGVAQQSNEVSYRRGTPQQEKKESAPVIKGAARTASGGSKTSGGGGAGFKYTLTQR